MSGRHGKKHKKDRSKKVVSTMADQIPTAISRADNPQNEAQEIENKYSRIPVYKPPDSMVAVWGLLAAIVVAAIYFFQYLAMLNSIQVLKAQFQQDQRPYVYSTKYDPAQLLPNNWLASNVYYGNFGKSPAYHLTWDGRIFHGKDAIGQANNWFDKLGQGPLSQQMTEGLLIQGKEPATTLLMDRAPVENTTIESIEYTIVMRLQYFDSVEIPRYWTDVCWWHPPNGSTSEVLHCPKHTEVH
jgi:hypothetical protein